MRFVAELSVTRLDLVGEVGRDPVNRQRVGVFPRMLVQHISRPVEVGTRRNPVPVHFAHFLVGRGIVHRGESGGAVGASVSLASEGETQK